MRRMNAGAIWGDSKRPLAVAHSFTGWEAEKYSKAADHQTSTYARSQNSNYSDHEEVSVKPVGFRKFTIVKCIGDRDT